MGNFPDSYSNMEQELLGDYNLSLVLLSFGIAVLASYLALDLARRVRSTSENSQLWLWGGAVAMGTGIWSMHFIAMVAFHLPLAVNYDLLATLLSLVYAILSSGIALWLLSLPDPRLFLLLGGGVSMGLAIAWMHYTGMSAIHCQVSIHYDLKLVGLSIVIAISASLTALWLAFRLREQTVQKWQQIGSAVVMGIAISGMHYTGMVAAHFTARTGAPMAVPVEPALVLNPAWLAVCIAIATLLILGGTLLISLFDQQMANQNLRQQMLQESAKRERTISNVVQRMRQTLELETIFSTTTEELRQAIQCDRVLIYRFNPDWSGGLVSESVADGWNVLLPARVNDTVTQVAVDRSNCVITKLNSDGLVQDTYLKDSKGGIYRQKTSYCCVPDISQAGYDPCYLNFLKQLQAQAYTIAPIFCGDRLWGLLAVYQNSGPRQWQEAEVRIVTQISNQLGVAVQQAELFAQTQYQAEELKQAKEAADAANRAKTEFLANMSHELRTPLNAILGFTQLMQRDDLIFKHQRYVEIINQSGEHLLALINDVLEMSKIEAGRVTVHETEFDLHKLLHSLVAMLQLKANSKGLRLSFNCEADVPQYIKADENKLRQVLLNLLSNATKFTTKGSVTLRVRLGEKCSRDGSPASSYFLTFEVKDTGPGIELEELDYLFKAFQQTRAGQLSKEGTGLGLRISQQFVQLMGGDITVESEPGKGSCFTFSIRVDIAETGLFTAPLSIKNATAVIPGQTAHRILIAEDNLANRLLLSKLLQPLGFEVRETENGQAAIALWQWWQPHLIFMDMCMPIVDGYEAARQIRSRERESKNKRIASTKIIALTASAFAEQRQASLEVGCDDFVSKPFRWEEILKVLSEHLGVQYLHSEVAIDKADISIPTEFILDAVALAVMPTAWIAQLHDAAAQGNDLKCLQLVAQIPPERTELVEALTHWVEIYQFDQLMALTQQTTQQADSR